MKTFFFKTLAAALLTGTVFAGAALPQTFAKTRTIILADMGNEPDEMQQNVHLMMYANEIDLEGLIAVTGVYLSAPRPWLYDTIVRNYTKVYDNLVKHASGWPTPGYLNTIWGPGQPGYGYASVGKGKSSFGSRLIDSALLKKDPRKLYVVFNAGSNTMLQALRDLDARFYGTLDQPAMDAIISKIIVYDNGGQDDCGAWIAHDYPAMNYTRSKGLTYVWGGNAYPNPQGPNTWEPYPFSSQGQHSWAKEHIMTNHGPLGAIYPYRNNGDAFLEGGGTTPWMGLVCHGLADPANLWWGGWSGRSARTKSLNITANSDKARSGEIAAKPYYMYPNDNNYEKWTDPVTGINWDGSSASVWRFRRAMWNDERARFDWCVKEYNQANHNPGAAVNGDTADTIITMTLKPGAILNLDASATKDPDNDAVRYHWWIYHEAGTYTGTVGIPNPAAKVTAFTVPADANGKEIHVILEVRDTGNVNSIVSMYDYRRIVITVSSTAVFNVRPVNLVPRQSTTVFTTGDRLVLPVDFRDRECLLAVFDLTGKCVKRAAVKTRGISLRGQLSLPAGAYLVKIENFR